MVVRRGRRRSPGDHRSLPEAAPGPLDAGQGARLRGVVRRSFARHGVKVTVDDDHAEATDGTVYALPDLDARCEGAREPEWQQIVDGYVNAVVRFTPGWDPVASLTTEELLSRTYLRVVDRSVLRDPRGLAYARPLAGDLVEAFAVDVSGLMVNLRDDAVAQIGDDPLREAGRRNLLLALGDRYGTVDAPGGGTFHVVTGESPHVASTLLVFPEVLARALGDADVPHGVLVAVPDRHSLVFHPVRDASVVPALQALAEVVAAQADRAEQVSPFVYWWRPDGLTQLSRDDGRGGRLRIAVDDEFGAVLEAVAEE